MESVKIELIACKEKLHKMNIMEKEITKETLSATSKMTSLQTKMEQQEKIILNYMQEKKVGIQGKPNSKKKQEIMIKTK